MRKQITKFLLFLLNRFLNGTPAEYGLINNVDAFSRGFLEDQPKDQTMGEFLEEVYLFDSCLESGEGCVIIGKTVYKGDDILFDELTKSNEENLSM